MITTNSLITKLGIISTTPRCALETSFYFWVSLDRCQPSSSSRHTWAVRSFTWADQHTQNVQEKGCKNERKKVFHNFYFLGLQSGIRDLLRTLLSEFSVWQKNSLAPNQARPRNSFRHKTIENRDFSPLNILFPLLCDFRFHFLPQPKSSCLISTKKKQASHGIVECDEVAECWSRNKNSEKERELNFSFSSSHNWHLISHHLPTRSWNKLNFNSF